MQAYTVEFVYHVTAPIKNRLDIANYYQSCKHRLSKYGNMLSKSYTVGGLYLYFIYNYNY